MSRLVISIRIRVERALSRRRTADCLSNIKFDYKDAVRLEAERNSALVYIQKQQIPKQVQSLCLWEIARHLDESERTFTFEEAGHLGR